MCYTRYACFFPHRKISIGYCLLSVWAKSLFTVFLHKLQLKNRLFISVISLISWRMGWAFPWRQLTASCFGARLSSNETPPHTFVSSYLTILYLSWKKDYTYHHNNTTITINRWTYPKKHGWLRWKIYTPLLKSHIFPSIRLRNLTNHKFYVHFFPTRNWLVPYIKGNNLQKRIFICLANWEVSTKSFVHRGKLLFWGLFLLFRFLVFFCPY